MSIPMILKFIFWAMLSFGFYQIMYDVSVETVRKSGKESVVQEVMAMGILSAGFAVFMFLMIFY